MNHSTIFAIKASESIISPEDSGLVNGKIAVNGWLHDLAEIRGIYAPPFFSDDFKSVVRFNGKRVAACDNLWEPDQLTRKGKISGFSFVSRLIPCAGRRAVILAIKITNRSKTHLPMLVQYELVGGIGIAPHWGFGKPRNCPFALSHSFDDGIFSIDGQDCRIAFASSLPLAPALPLVTGVLNTPVATIQPRESFDFYSVVAIGGKQETADSIAEVVASPEGAINQAKKHWRNRVRQLMSVMPSFESDNRALEKLYYRSLLHLLLNEWDVPEFLLHPYYATGAINGGCLCCYLWNYGEPYKLWSILNPQSVQDHLKTFLKLDLGNCYAFFPEDGSPNGPCYPVNQEKVIFLAHAYVMNTGDVSFLHEQLNGKIIIQHLIDQAMMHDDLNQEAI
ncbi:MAG: hypothetical protein GX561_08090 [Lentisphaerae bacterium]|nr:hypothetical protein [Lentisphaerota bacterium]